MFYVPPRCFPADESLLAAWDSQLAELKEIFEFTNATPAALFPRFAAHYARICALPRRALMRKLARSRQPAWPRSLNAPVRRKLACSIAGAALLLALAPGAEAATITVTTNIPTINDSDGKCSLNEAIENANDDAATHPDCTAGSGADMIVLPKRSTIVLTTAYAGRMVPLLSGTPWITSALTIEGNGTTIVGERTSPAGGTSQFTILTVDTSGDVTLDNLTLQNGIYGIVNYGAATINNSVISGNNHAGYVGIAFVAGGGIKNGGRNHATMTIANSIITGNRTHGSYEHSRGGAGISNSGVAYIQQSTISDNAADYGGGIDNFGTLIIENSTISGNLALRSIGGPLFGGLIATGGGIVNYRYTRIENSTVSGNSASAGDHTSDARGGGIANVGFGTLVIASSTISDNTAIGNPVESSFGGGVFSSGDLTLGRSLVSGNTAMNGPEIYAIGAVAADDFNLFGSNGDAGVVGFTPGATDIVPAAGIAVNQILAPLAYNGGPTETQALVKGSPAIDAAPVDSECPPTDQRGFTRPIGDGCDIGSFEFKNKGKSKGKGKK
jgi:hypothetical protein